MTTPGPQKPYRADLANQVGQNRTRIRILEANPFGGPDGPWIPITSFVNNWIDAGISGEPQVSYAITAQGWVIFRGRIADGDYDNRAFTMPAGAIIEADETFITDRLPGGYSKVQALSTGDILVPTNSVAGFPAGFHTDDASTDGVAPLNLVLTSTTSAADMFGNTYPYHTSGIGGVPLLEVFGAGPYGFGIATAYGGALPIGTPACALQLPYYGGPYGDSEAAITVKNAALVTVDLGVRCRVPFMGNGGFPAPVGVHFEIAKTGGGTLRIYVQEGDASQQNLATGSSPGFAVNDIISFNAIGNTYIGSVNGLTALEYDGLPVNDGFQQGFCSFGLDGSSKSIILATDFQYGAPANAHGQSIALDGIMYRAFA